MKKLLSILLMFILILVPFHGVSSNIATPTDLEPEITYPFTVTYIFYYRGANANWKSVSSTQTVTDEHFNNSKAVSFFSKQITRNNLQTVSSNTMIYEWLGTWTGEMGTLTDNDRVYTNTTLFHTTTTVTFYADYKETSLSHLNFVYDDYIGNGGGSWANEDGFVGYTHTFTTPPDIPDHYDFLYWTDGEEQFIDGQSKTINIHDIDGNVTMNYIATYNYQPGIIINYHYGENIYTFISYEAVNIYANAPILAHWYLNDTDLLDEDFIVDLPEKIQTTTLLDTMVEVDVYANFIISWIDYDETLLEEDIKVPYGEVPTFDGDEPAREDTETIIYKFIKWIPEVVAAIQDETYMAVYDETEITPSPSPTPTPTPTPSPTEAKRSAPTPTPTPTPVITESPTPEITETPSPTPTVSSAPEITNDIEYIRVLVHYVDINNNKLMDDFYEWVPVGIYMLRIPNIRGYHCITKIQNVQVLFENWEVTLVYDEGYGQTIIFGAYDTPLGINGVIAGQVGDCYE